MKNSFQFFVLFLILIGTMRYKCYAQNTTKVVPDGTTGSVLEVNDSDYLTKKNR